jgi:hypothetical protein
VLLLLQQNNLLEGEGEAGVGSLSVTLGALTVSSTATLDIAGTASITLAALTSSATSTLDNAGTLTQTLAALTLSATSTISGEVNGSLSVTLDSLRLNAEGVDPNRRNSGAGSRTKRRRRYVVEIDGQDFEVSGPEEARALLERAKVVAETAIAKAQTTRVAPGRPSFNRPVIRTPDAELRPLVVEARNEITDLYDQAIRDLEIAALMRKRIEDEEEEALIQLLM